MHKTLKLTFSDGTTSPVDTKTIFPAVQEKSPQGESLKNLWANINVLIGRKSNELVLGHTDDEPPLLIYSDQYSLYKSQSEATFSGNLLVNNAHELLEERSGESIKVNGHTKSIGASTDLTAEGLRIMEEAIPDEPVRTEFINFLCKAQNYNDTGVASNQRLYQHPETKNYCITYDNHCEGYLDGPQSYFLNTEGENISLNDFLDKSVHGKTSPENTETVEMGGPQ